MRIKNIKPQIREILQDLIRQVTSTALSAASIAQTLILHNSPIPIPLGYPPIFILMFKGGKPKIMKGTDYEQQLKFG